MESVSENPKPPEKMTTAMLNIRAAISSLLVSSILFIIKISVGIIGNSMAVLASALDSAFDFFSSAVNFYAIKQGQKPADTFHRYGYGKAEALAGFLQSIIILLSSLVLIYRSIYRLINPVEIGMVQESVYVMIVSIALTWVLVTYQSYVHKKSNSIAIAADRLHYVTDLLGNAAVLVTLLIGKYIDIPFLDAGAAVLIGLFIMKSSFDIFRKSFAILMDKDISDKYREDIIQAIATISPELHGYHDLRSRSVGEVDFVEFHLEISQNMMVRDSHDLVEKIMSELEKKHPNLEIIIHTDPAEVDSKTHKVKIFDKDKPRFY